MPRDLSGKRGARNMEWERQKSFRGFSTSLGIKKWTVPRELRASEKAKHEG